MNRSKFSLSLLVISTLVTTVIVGADRLEFVPLQTTYLNHQTELNNNALQTIEKKIGYTFNKQSRLKKALTTKDKNPATNLEVYEYLGDVLLKQAQAEQVQKEFPKATPGERTAVKCAIESMAPLAALGVRLGIHNYIQDTEQSITPNVIEDAMEALTYAIYKDGGTDAAQRFINRFFYPMIKGHTTLPETPSRIIRRAFPNHNLYLEDQSTQTTTRYRRVVSQQEQEGYVKWNRNRSKKINPAPFVACYNADVNYVLNHLSEEHQKKLITWPLNSDYKEFDGSLDLHLSNPSGSARAHLHTLLAKLHLSKPEYTDIYHENDKTFVSSIELDLNTHHQRIEGKPAPTKKVSREDAAQKAIGAIQTKIILPEQVRDLPATSLNDLLPASQLYTLLYENGPWKTQLTNFCQKYNLEKPTIYITRRPGLVTQPIQYVATLTSDWLDEKYKSKPCLQTGEAREDVAQQAVKNLYKKIRLVRNKKICPKNLVLFEQLRNALQNTDKTKISLLNELAAKTNNDKPKFINKLTATDITENILSQSTVSFNDMQICGDPQSSIKQAENSAAEKLLQDWLRKLKKTILSN